MIVGFNPTAAKIAELLITRKELIFAGRECMPINSQTAIEWFAKQEVQTEPLISHEFAFADIEEAFTLLETSPEKTCKVLITF